MVPLKQGNRGVRHARGVKDERGGVRWHPYMEYYLPRRWLSGAIFGKYPLFILFSLTFSLGPDEVATVW